jgi:PAS domain S-box-containing protein
LSPEEALRRSEARLRATLDTAVDAIITIDERGVIQSVNRATTRIFGYTEDEMVGQNVSMLMPSPYREEHDSYLERHVRTGEKRIMGIGREMRALRKDGTEFPVDLAVSEVEPRRLFTGMIRDISDRKLAESRAREADRMASIGTLAAGLGHDMNNVLLPVRARLNALHADGQAGKLPPVDLKHVEEVRKSVAYLQQLADGLHFLAMDPESEDAVGGVTDLRQWWSQAGPLLSKAVPKHVTVTSSIPATLPQVAVASHGLTQAVLNLVVNAGSAIPLDSKVPGRVRVSARVSQEAGPTSSVLLSVSDNGVGMTEEVKRRCFELFFTTKPRGLGTGLGLALVRKVAQTAGGSVSIQSQLGKGTTVSMHLPMARLQPAVASNPVAVVSVSDGRAAALIQHLLEAGGVVVKLDAEPGPADIWVTEPTDATLKQARSWCGQPGRGVLVLLGVPERSNAEWGAFQPVMIAERESFEAVRDGVIAATAKAMGES